MSIDSPIVPRTSTGRAGDDLPPEVRALIGVKKSATNIVTDRDIRHFAQAIGDDNPLYHDEDFGKLSRHGTMIAPPLFCQAYAFSDLPIAEMPVDLSPAEADVPVPAERTVGGSSKYEFFEPVRPGDAITLVTELKDVIKKAGRNGDLYLVVVETSFFRQDDVLVAREEATYVKK